MKKTKKWITNILLVVFALIFVVSAVMVVDYVIKSFQANSQKNDLLDLKNNPPHLTLEEPTKGPAGAGHPAGVPRPLRDQFRPGGLGHRSRHPHRLPRHADRPGE